jgi:lipoprotein NlpD
MLAACISPQRSGNQYTLYTVRHGDTLYAVAWRYKLDFKRLAAWNGINKPYVIYPGQKLRLNPLSTPTKRAKRSSKTKERRANSRKEKPAKVAMSKQPVYVHKKNVPDTAPVRNSMEWYWPAAGDVIKVYSAQARGKKGIDIAGRPGQSIKAASAGKVVYSGSGLIGYGQLIIIKHDNNYLSAYAHNRSLFVREGDQVKLGQKIAELGSTGTDRPKLHFEIRRNGEPVDPLRYLPKK